MKSKVEIEKLLNELDNFYNQPYCSNEHAQLYSKIALLELCGWLEVTLDEIVKNYALDTAVPKLTKPKNVEYLKENVIRKTSGFKYDRNFRPMLIHTIGIIGVEKLEKECEADLQNLKSVLGTIEKERDVAAHTSIAGVTSTYDSPSVIKNKLNQLCPILEKIEKELNKI